jgi:predicted nucleotidyltransferase
METKPPLRSDLLQPVQLRLDGLFERIQHLERALEEVPDGLSDNIRRRLERAALFRGLNAIQRSYEAIGTVLCLILDGSTPDDEESWYGDALDQLSGTGSGRVPVVPPSLADRLRVVGVYPDFDPVLELEPNLAVQRRRHAAAVRAAPMLVDALTALDALLADGRLRDGQEPDPEFAKQHAERLKRAETRKQALARALTDIENAFLEKGYRVIPFGSVAENRVHGRSDLDLLVVGEMSREAQRELWDTAEEIAREEGVEVDLHFPGLYSGDFLDRLKAIRGGQIVPLRDLIAAATDPKTQRD